MDPAEKVQSEFEGFKDIRKRENCNKWLHDVFKIYELKMRSIP